MYGIIIPMRSGLDAGPRELRVMMPTRRRIDLRLDFRRRGRVDLNDQLREIAAERVGVGPRLHAGGHGLMHRTGAGGDRLAPAIGPGASDNVMSQLLAPPVPVEAFLWKSRLNPIHGCKRGDDAQHEARRISPSGQQWGRCK